MMGRRIVEGRGVELKKYRRRIVVWWGEESKKDREKDWSETGRRIDEVSGKVLKWDGEKDKEGRAEGL